MSIFTNIPEGSLVIRATDVAQTSGNAYERKKLEDVRKERKQQKKKIGIKHIKKEIRSFKHEIVGWLTKGEKKDILSKLRQAFNPEIYSSENRPYGSELAQNMYIIEWTCRLKGTNEEKIEELFETRIGVYELLSDYQEDKDKSILEQIVLGCDKFLDLSKEILLE